MLCLCYHYGVLLYGVSGFPMKVIVSSSAQPSCLQYGPWMRASSTRPRSSFCLSFGKDFGATMMLSKFPTTSKKQTLQNHVSSSLQTCSPPTHVMDPINDPSSSFLLTCLSPLENNSANELQNLPTKCLSEFPSKSIISLKRKARFKHDLSFGIQRKSKISSFLSFLKTKLQVLTRKHKDLESTLLPMVEATV